MHGSRTGCILAALLLTGCQARDLPAKRSIPPDAAAVECVNPANGFAWTFRLNAAAGTVDDLPARFGKERISWRDHADGGFYELELASGALTIVRASSTGGYTSSDRCAVATSLGAGDRPEASP
jgi:hypothetical protein